MIEFIIIFVIVIGIASLIPGVSDAIDQMDREKKRLLKKWETEEKNNINENHEQLNSHLSHLDYQIKKLQVQMKHDKRLAAEINDPDTVFKKIPDINKKNYMQSDKWDQIRKAVLQRDNYTCRKCNASDITLDVHHLHYRSLGNESLEDLITVCRSCHNEIHDLHGYNPYHIFPLNEYDILNTHIDEDELPF